MIPITALAISLSCSQGTKQSDEHGKTEVNDSSPMDSANTTADSINGQPTQADSSKKVDTVEIPRPKNIRKISETLGKKYGRIVFDTPMLTRKPIPSKIESNQVEISVLTQPIAQAAVPDTIRLRLFNCSADTILTGLHYDIQYWTKEKWKKVEYEQNLSIVTEDIGHILPPLQSSDYVIQLFTDLYDFKKGKYRIRKYYLDNNQPPPKKSNDVYAEFKID